MSDSSRLVDDLATFDPVFDVALVRRALAEDVGRGDVTTEATIPAGTQASGRIVARQPGVVAGLPIVAVTFRLLDPAVRVEAVVTDGAHVEAGVVSEHRVGRDVPAVLVGDDGQIVGVVSAADVQRVPPERWTTTPLRAIMTPASSVTDRPPPEAPPAWPA